MRFLALLVAVLLALCVVAPAHAQDACLIAHCTGQPLPGGCPVPPPGPLGNVCAVLTPAPVTFNLDPGALLGNSATVFNGIWPALVVIFGITLGGLMLKVAVDRLRGLGGDM